MQNPVSVTEKVYIVICAAITWFGVLLQLYLIITNRQMSIPATVVQFLSFFTIQCNILVAVCFTTLPYKSAANNFFIKQKTLAATAVYITIVGAIYNLVLRRLWQPKGWQFLADNILHVLVLVPVLFVLYWVFAVAKNSLQWKDLLPWLIYPFIYLIYILIRGAFTNLYPYPFVDVETYGYAKVMMNSVWVMVGFITVSLLFIGLGKMMSRSSIKN